MAEHIHFRIRKNHFFFLIIIILTGFMFLSNIRFNGFKPEILAGDGRGYYAYLPAIFVHGTLDFETVLQHQKDRLGEHFQGHYYFDHEDIKLNKFTSGVALLLTPFFLLSLLISSIFGLPTDGYSVVSQWGIISGAIFYAFLGLLFLFKLLRSMGFENKNSMFSIVIFFFGTNLLFYTFMHPSMSHVYSFSIACIFMCFIHRVFTTQKTSAYFWASVTFGLIVLIRPFNILIILALPFLVEKPADIGSAINAKISNINKALASVLPALFIISIQIIIYLIQSGKLWAWSYPGEGFNFGDPHLSDVLFSYRKGLFVYTPLILVSLLGFIPLFKRNHFRAISGFLFFLFILYFISSWWNWFYGDSFGMRPFIDYYPVFIILFAYLLQSKINVFFRGLLNILIILIVIFNLIQTYQYHNGIIHPDAMNKEKYWYIFMKTDKSYQHILGDTDEALFKESPLQLLKTYSLTFDSIPENWDIKESAIVSDTLDQKNTLFCLDSLTLFNPTLKIKEDSLILKKQKLWSEVEFTYYDLDTNATMRAFFVVSVTDNNNVNTFYKSFRIKPYPNDTILKPDTASIEFNIESVNKNTEEIRLYIWNPERLDFCVDDVSIKLYRIEEKDQKFEKR